MKKLSLMPIAALLIAFVFSSFTNEPKQIKHEDPLWYFTLSTVSGEDERTNYVPLDEQDGGCGGQGTVRCVIEAPEYLDTNTPDLSSIVERSFKP